ncbi:hypothetical protein H6G35_09740 [Aulosira sp. FACHB-113]|uniref:hypothetical protein n=1 Tax=Tolypothrix tenuis TaxID=457083 RepID=UPI001685274D|nr:hypothetical protein [Aulosira sp. FACHB-113]
MGLKRINHKSLVVKKFWLLIIKAIALFVFWSKISDRIYARLLPIPHSPSPIPPIA